MASELDRARDRLAIYEALTRVLADPHALMELMLSAQSPEVAADALEERFGLDTVQAAAVLDMQLRQVTAQHRERIAASQQELADHVTSLGGTRE